MRCSLALGLVDHQRLNISLLLVVVQVAEQLTFLAVAALAVRGRVLYLLLLASPIQ